MRGRVYCGHGLGDPVATWTLARAVFLYPYEKTTPIFLEHYCKTPSLCTGTFLNKPAVQLSDLHVYYFLI